MIHDWMYTMFPLSADGESLTFTPDGESDRPVYSARQAWHLIETPRTGYRFDEKTWSWVEVPVAAWKLLHPNGQVERYEAGTTAEMAYEQRTRRT